MKSLNIAEKQNVSYCIPLWQRDEQIKLAIARNKPLITGYPQGQTRPEPVAVACFGPSLSETWAKIRDFKYIISCSGSHKFLAERGIIPTWHVEVDPREHKVALIGQPHKNVEYLISSTCHPKVFDHLEGYNVKLWHVFDGHENGMRALPHGQWAITGGCSVGLRAMTIARFMGFTDLHVFGMDGCEGKTGKHAAAHPNSAKDALELEYDGKKYLTIPSFLEAAKQTFHELDQMPDVKATFYGDGLVQAMAKKYVPDRKTPPVLPIAITKPEVISPEYRALNAELHKTNVGFGVGGGKHAATVLKLAQAIKTTSILDYGCGKGYLAKALPFPIWEYDPAIPEKDASPRPADLVVCTDVLEHIEPDKLYAVLKDLERCTNKVGYFIIHTGPSSKTLSDGRNAHLIQKPREWWEGKLAQFFKVGKITVVGPLLFVLVGVKTK